MAWEGERERESESADQKGSDDEGVKCRRCPLSVWGSALIPPFASFSLFHEVSGNNQ